jgi:glycosyltransferase involved in cell wall biosynthesis
MNITQFVRYFSPVIGGVENYVLNLSRTLVRRGHNVTVYTLKIHGTRESEVIDGVLVKRYKLWNLLSQLRKTRTDVVHCHQYRLYHTDLAVWSISSMNIPVVLTLHGVYPPSDIWHAIYYKCHDLFLAQRTLHLVRKITALTPDEIERITKLGASQNKITIIPNAINIEEFEHIPRNAREDFRRKFGIKEDDKVILFVGHLAWNKRVEDIIRALPMMSQD